MLKSLHRVTDMAKFGSMSTLSHSIDNSTITRVYPFGEIRRGVLISPFGLICWVQNFSFELIYWVLKDNWVPNYPRFWGHLRQLLGLSPWPDLRFSTPNPRITPSVIPQHFNSAYRLTLCGNSWQGISPRAEPTLEIRPYGLQWEGSWELIYMHMANKANWCGKVKIEFNQERHATSDDKENGWKIIRTSANSFMSSSMSNLNGLRSIGKEIGPPPPP